jgi:hypothetical protein
LRFQVLSLTGQEATLAQERHSSAGIAVRAYGQVRRAHVESTTAGQNGSEMSQRSTYMNPKHIREIQTNEVLRKRLAKYIALHCFRNTDVLEEHTRARYLSPSLATTPT